MSARVRSSRGGGGAGDRTGDGARTRIARRDARPRGFSLIELMVVVIIIGVIAALAIPSMLQATLDRNAYDDAGAIMQLLREARTRAVARGAAVAILVTSSSTDRGTFTAYEAVTQNETGPVAYETPVGTCKRPQVWVGNHQKLFASLNLNGTIEADANISMSIWDYMAAAPTQKNLSWICFTPLGHSFLDGNASPLFDGLLPTVHPLEFRVQRLDSSSNPLGTTRSVILPPNGMARIFSHT